MNLEEVGKKFQIAVDLVNEWGESELPDGRKLASVFTYDSIPFWEMLVVSMALYSVPKVLFINKNNPFLLNRIVTYLKKGKTEIIKRKYYIDKIKCYDRSSRPVFLFLGFQPYIYYDIIWPIVKNVANDKLACPVTLYDYLPLQKHCSGIENGKFQSVWRYWDTDVRAESNRLMHLLKKDIKELKSLGILPKIIKNQGRSFWPQMEDVFDWLFIVYLPYLIKHFAIAKKIFHCYRPDVIISGDVSEPRNRLYCLLARHLNIPTLDVQFGVYGKEAVEWQFSLTDRVVVWGESSKNILKWHGVPEERIVLSGSPRHDCMISISNAEILQTRSILRIPDSTTMVLFASNYLNIHDQIEDPLLLDSVKHAIFKAVDQADGICLVVKPHPNEKINETKKFARGYRNILFVRKNDDLNRLIRACDVFMSIGSTATMDALIANKLTVCPNLPGCIGSDLFINSGAVLVPKTYEELLQCLKETKEDDRKKILKDLEPARQRFLQQWIFKLDDQSSNRIKLLLFDMAKNNKVPGSLSINKT